jgi:hypothetical protein
MKFENIIESGDFNRTLQSAKTALEQLGYHLKSDTGRTWVYARGNFWGALFAISPKSWQSTVVLEQVSSGLLIRLMVNMFGKVEVPAGVNYWQKEVNYICRLAAGESLKVENVKFDRPPFFKPLALIIGVQFVFLSLGGIFAMMMQNMLAFYVFAIIGTILMNYIISNTWTK